MASIVKDYDLKMENLSHTDLKYADAIARTLAKRTLDDLWNVAGTLADEALRIEW